jgi:hypothetical protein
MATFPFFSFSRHQYDVILKQLYLFGNKKGNLEIAMTIREASFNETRRKYT